MQNCKNPDWLTAPKPVQTMTLSARLDGTVLCIVDARGAILASVDIAPAVQAVLDAQKKRKRT